MSAEIIQFVPRPKADRTPTDYPRLVFYSTARRDDLAADRTDTAACQYVAANLEEIRMEDG